MPNPSTRACTPERAVVNLPTALTLVRVVLVPLLLVFFYLPTDWSNMLAAAVFALAAMTDMLDGYLARQLSQVTRLGAFLDPVADKLIVVTALVLIVEDAASWTVTLPALVIVAREITVSALRGWMAEIGQPDIVAVNFWGKLKTFLQMFAIIALLLQQPFFGAGLVLLYLAAALTVWSMLAYLMAARRHLSG